MINLDSVVPGADNLVRVTLSRDDLSILKASVNEAIEALDAWEFPIRVGYEVEEAERLRSELGNVIRNLSATR